MGAVLRGIEARASSQAILPSPGGASEGDRRDAGLLDLDQLKALLIHSNEASAPSTTRPAVWIPAVVRTVTRPWLTALLASRLRSHSPTASGLTFAFAESDAAADRVAFASCARALNSLGVRVALSEVAHPPAWRDLVQVRVDEIRLGNAWTAAEHEHKLADLADRLHRAGTIVTALDIKTSEQCGIAIAAGIDLLQGDLIGRPRTFESVDAMLHEWVSSPCEEAPKRLADLGIER